MKKILYTLLASIVFFSCEKDNRDCMVPPPMITFFVLDNENNNLVADKTITANNIKITDSQGKDMKYFVQNEEKIVLPIGIEGGERNFKITISNKDSIIVLAKVRDHNCGSSLSDSKIISSTLSYQKDWIDRYTLKY